MKNNIQHSAQAQCATGIDHYVRFSADAAKHIDTAIASSPDSCLPYLVKAWMLYGAHDAKFSDEITQLIKLSRDRLHTSANREAELLSALQQSHSGHSVEGAKTLEKMITDTPQDLFLHTLIQEEIFWLGRSDWMRDIVERSATHWNETDTGYGEFLSLRSFANEEAGYFDAAERYGMQAVEINPSDVWGAHAVAHVLLMKGEMNRGIDWLEGLSGNWANANQMQHHLWWHLCLFLLETYEHERILSLLDTKIRDPHSPLIQASPAATIDINNYSSLLMRLELYGVDVSKQWQTLVDLCTERVNNHASAFSNIHDMMVLSATGHKRQADALLNSMMDSYGSFNATGSLAESYQQVGIPVCKAIEAHYNKDYAHVIRELGDVRHQLHRMGASHAQRDVFFHMLVHAAEQEQETDLRRILIEDIERLGFCKVPERAAYKNSFHKH
jgi:hypothetical protein